MMTNRSNGKPRRPRLRYAEKLTPEEAQKFEEYIKQLRDWLNSLSDEEHDKALKRLTSEELDHLTWMATYENYQRGGMMREIVEGTLLTNTGKAG
jgi:hypothetical protein